MSQGPILVTGPAGHLGANLVRALLDADQRVRAFVRESDDNSAVSALADHPGLEVAAGDLRDFDSLRVAARGCSRAYHVGAMVSTIDGTARHRREIFESNVLGTRNVLAACREAGVGRVVVTGSFSAVGYHLDDPSRPADESVQFYPFHRTMPYERSKVLVEHEVLDAVANGQDVVIATSCAIVGGHDYLPSRMGRTLCDFANRKLRAYVEGGFEFVTTTDIVAGHRLAMRRGRPGHKYIISSEFKTISQILDLFEEVTGVRRPRLRLPSPVMGAFAEVASFYLSRLHPRFPQRLTPGAIRLLRMRRRADTTKARTELGLSPTTIREAIHEAYAFHWTQGRISNAKARPPRAIEPSTSAAAGREAA